MQSSQFLCKFLKINELGNILDIKVNYKRDYYVYGKIENEVERLRVKSQGFSSILLILPK